MNKSFKILMLIALLSRSFTTHCDPEDFPKYGKVLVVGAVVFTSARLLYNGVNNLLYSRIKIADNASNLHYREQLNTYYSLTFPEKKQLGISMGLCFLGTCGLFASWKLSDYIR
jgi:hypothetical protein